MNEGTLVSGGKGYDGLNPRVIKNALVVLAIRMTNDIVDGAKLVR